MQRVTRTVQRTSLLSECLQRAPSCLRNSIPPKSPRSVRRFSISRSAANSLPAFEFLHPPVVRDAVNKSRHLEKQTRGYRDENSDHLNNANITLNEGWNQFIPAREKWVNADIERQEQLFKSREPAESDKETIRRMFQEMDTITIKKQQTLRITLDRHAKLKQELSLLNSSAAKRLENPCDPALDVKDTFHPELSVERQSSLDAFKAILRGMMEDKERQAVSIYEANDLRLYLNFTEKRIFATYLYRSSHREDLEALLRLFPNNPLVVPALCRLDRLDEAAKEALRNLYNVNNGATRLQVVVVMQVLSNKGEWQKVIDFWEAAVMAPTISTALSIVRSQQDNILLEHCLSHIPNVMDWYISKTAAMISDPKVDPKMLEYIKVLGGVIIKGLARVQDVFVDTLKLFRYQVETFREIDQNVLLWEMRSLRMCGRPKAAVEMYLSYRDNEFAVIEHQRDYDEETGRNIKLFIQNEAMASASLLNNFPILKQIFEDIYALGFEPDIYSYSIIMHAFARHGQADTVRELFETYRASGREPNIYVYAELLFVHATLLDIPAVEKTFKEIQAAGLDPGIVVYGMLTTAYARTLDVEGAMRVFRTFIRAGNKPTTMIIGHLISLFANRGDTDAAVEMFNMLGEFGLSPDHACMNPLLNAFATVEDRINAEAVVTKMRQLGLKPNIVTWNTLLKMYGSRKELASVVDVLARMRRSGVEPNEQSWSQVMHEFARTGDKSAVPICRRIMQRMTELQIKPNVFHWGALLSATVLGQKGDLLAMQRVYDEMLDNGVKPNYYIHAMLVSAYCKHGGEAGIEISEGILARLTSISNHLDLTSYQAPRTALSPAIFAPLFIAQGPKLQSNMIQEVFDNYVRSTSSVGGSVAEPDLDMLNGLIDIYRQHGDLRAVKRVWKAIKAHADRASRSFRSTTEETTTFVVPGNRYLIATPFSHYMRALADGGELEEIDLAWDQLASEGYDFNCENWNTRIKLCLIHEKHIVWAFRACEEVLMDGWERSLKLKRKKKSIRSRRQIDEKRMSTLINRVIWPIEDDLMDFGPLEEPKALSLPELFPYRTTTEEFLRLRQKLLYGMSIVDSSGHRRPGPEVWERLKQAFPRIVRAMLLHHKTLSPKKRREFGVKFDLEEGFGLSAKERRREDTRRDVEMNGQKKDPKVKKGAKLVGGL